MLKALSSEWPASPSMKGWLRVPSSPLSYCMLMPVDVPIVFSTSRMLLFCIFTAGSGVRGSRRGMGDDCAACWRMSSMRERGRDGFGLVAEPAFHLERLGAARASCWDRTRRRAGTPPRRRRVDPPSRALWRARRAASTPSRVARSSSIWISTCLRVLGQRLAVVRDGRVPLAALGGFKALFGGAAARRASRQREPPSVRLQPNEVSMRLFSCSSLLESCRAPRGDSTHRG